MKTDFFDIYKAIEEYVRDDIPVKYTDASDWWSLAAVGNGVGVAMTTRGCSIPPMYPEGLSGLSVSAAAKAAASWNLTEAGFGLAAVNAWCNTPANIARLDCAEPFENYCTRGIDFEGMTVGLIGHLHGPEDMREKAKKVYILERKPQEGDYPDSACDWILPRCDLVLITGSSLVNKTLPHLLELCKNSITILTGPSVPLCPPLLELGIDRLAGMAVSDTAGMTARVREGAPGSPYCFGQTFLLKRR